ncbi:EpsD family peptidyl-prolyl cis-trans isomerase [Leptothrix cholodnii]|nr:EpsD family peptidyl-prolyl cis-trans isomerase [Leptothrix cholodnii]
MSTPCGAVRRTATALTLLAAAAMLVACGGGDKKGATQVAAKVNKEEISVHQINFVLQRQPGLKPEQAPAATKAVLEGLIDQELAIQEAQEQKIDRDPKVVMAIEAAKREILARAYADKLADTVSKPTDDEIAAYYKDKPALFAQRRVYTLHEFSIEAAGDAAKNVTALVQAAKSSDELSKQLTAASVKFASRVVTQPAENLPLAMIDRIGSLAEGQSLAIPSANGISAVFVAAAKPQPVTAEQAKPAIEQFLLNDRKRKLVADEMKRLRGSAKISYEGQFAAAAAANTTAAAASQ